MSLTANVAIFPFQSRAASQVRRIPRRRPPGASGEAALRWGAPSDFQYTTRFGVTQPRVVIWPDGDESEEDDAQLGLEFVETARQVSTLRVENPQDSEQFVDVERIERITFQGPDGVLRTFILNN